MNRKERRRLKKQAKKQAQKPTSAISSGQPSAPEDVSSMLFNHAMGTITTQREKMNPPR